MKVDALIKEVRAYRELLKDAYKEKANPVEKILSSIDTEMLKVYHGVLTSKDIQKILGIGYVQTYELLNSGEFHDVRISRSYKISKTVFSAG